MYNQDRFYSLTSPAGTFEFNRSVPLSHGKVVRDTITAAVFGTNGCPTPRRSENAMTWLRMNLEGSISKTTFEWYPA